MALNHLSDGRKISFTLKVVIRAILRLVFLKPQNSKQVKKNIYIQLYHGTKKRFIQILGESVCSQLANASTKIPKFVLFERFAI